MDLEIDFHHPSIEKRAHRQGVRIICSLHELSGQVAAADNKLNQLAAAAQEIPKVAEMLHSTSDLLYLLILGRILDKKLVSRHT